MKLLKAIAIGLSVFIILIGCQEDNVVSSPIELLTSKVWKLEAYGTDLNMNNNLDVEEDVIMECQKDNTYAFFSDGTGHYSDNISICGDEDESIFNWKFLHDNTSLEIAFEQFSVMRLTEQELVLRHDLQGITNKTFLRYTPRC